MSEITAIMPQKNDKTRCNIFLDGRFYCGLTLEVTIKNRLKVGMSIDEEKLSMIQLESEKSTALNKCLTHISTSQKTEKEILDFLQKKGYLSGVQEYVLEKMKEYGYINDEEYAESYVKGSIKRKGRRLIEMELRKKGVSEEYISDATENIEEEEDTAALEILKKYFRGKEITRENLQKGYRYLLSRGYDYEVAKNTISKISKIEEN